jgi:hypothetical protein
MAIKDIPIDVVPDEEFNARWGTKADGSWRGYAAGTPTEQRRSNEAKALSAALALEEEKRHNTLAETLAQKQFEADEKYRWAALAKSGSGGGGGGLTAYQQYQIMRDLKRDAYDTKKWILAQAAERAKNDSRLEGRKMEVPAEHGLGTMTITSKADGANVFTYQQLYDAHLRDLINQYGLDLADFGLQPLNAPNGGNIPRNFRDFEELSINQAKRW